MQISNTLTSLRVAFVAIAVISLSACGDSILKTDKPAAASIRDAPAVRLNFRYEADVPQPAADTSKAIAEERSAVVQADFDTNRSQDEILDRTVTSPDSKNIVAVYHRSGDNLDEFRLDMYSADGRLLRKLTSDTMAAHFPETIRWSPDSTTLAFVAILRVFQTPATTPSAGSEGPTPPITEANVNSADTTNSEVAEQPATPLVAAPTPAPPTGILAFRTEQIYTANADGSGVKPLTQDDGLKYFYYAWSPDSTMLVALAATAIEWKAFVQVADVKSEQMIPWGRPRIIEKNGRARRLDDTPTEVFPAWSPDSAKVAVAYGRQVSAFGQRAIVNNQIRIYDALGTNPTQAAIPLRNQLLISSQAYEQQQSADANASVDANNQPPPATNQLSSLPKEEELVSYNPIVNLAWTADDLIYFETAYVKRMKNEAENAHSFARWHRVVLSVQPPAAIK
jgi:hypothetical protein